MQGRKFHQPDLFASVIPSEMVPNDHLLRKIDKVIDLEFIYELTADLYCHNNGRTSVDPVMFFRIQIIAYLYGIKSDRRLCEEIHLNIAYRWFCRLNLSDPVPDHSSLTRIRDRFGEETYKTIFRQLIRQWKSVGIVKGKRLIADASLVEADAHLDSLVEREDSDPDARELKQYQKRYHDFRVGKKKRKLSNQTHKSSTDPDASLVSRKGNYRKLSYKVHYTIDADSRMITDCHGTSGKQHECQVLPERINLQIESFNFEIQEVIADKGYGRGPTYDHFRQKKIRAYIPLHTDNLGSGRISRGNFKYERKNDRYRCPHGHWMYPYDKQHKESVKRYRVVGGYCRNCPSKNVCLPDAHSNRARFVYRSVYQDEIDAIRRRQKTIHFKKKLKERSWKVEGLFGEAKENHNLRRARYRGLDKVQIQFYMTAMVQNFKRAVALIPSEILHIQSYFRHIWSRYFFSEWKIIQLRR